MSGWLYFVVEKGLLGQSPIYPATNNPYNATSSFVGITTMSLLLGILIGLVEELFFKNQLKRQPFFLKIFAKTILYLVMSVLLLLVSATFLNAYNMSTTVFDKQVTDTILSFTFSFTFLSVIIFIGIMIGACLFFSEIVDFLGLDVVGSFFTGKYSKSVIEDRIFMFLDMKGSTTIAERLGHEMHYQLINEYYSDMTEPIVASQGNIYQYVGDEIVIFWKLEEGVHLQNCINCFFQIRKIIDEKADEYQARYGLVPSFKAGLHVGKVTRGQVGLIKRELLFTGDVLNATARIQSMCNELNAGLLISAELKDKMASGTFDFIAKGAFDLKGRNQKMELFEVVK